MKHFLFWWRDSFNSLTVCQNFNSEKACKKLVNNVLPCANNFNSKPAKNTLNLHICWERHQGFKVWGNLLKHQHILSILMVLRTKSTIYKNLQQIGETIAWHWRLQSAFYTECHRKRNVIRMDPLDKVYHLILSFRHLPFRVLNMPAVVYCRLLPWLFDLTYFCLFYI